MKLLTVGNPKTAKGLAKGYLTAVLHLAPASLSGWNVCPASTQGCRAACLNTAGRGGITAGRGILTHDRIAAGERNAIQAARIARTQWLFRDRAGFIAALKAEIAALVRKAKREGLIPAVRLNGTSDIRWETEAFGNIPEAFPDVIFYDYTKLSNRRNVPANYHLTYSWNERDGDRGALEAFRNGMNVAMVFRSKALVDAHITTGRGVGGVAVVQVIDGDETDLRFLDPRGVIVGLYAKGAARHDKSGFVID